MREEVKIMSKRFLQMENDASATEKMYFPTKKIFKEEDNEDVKFSRALKYVIDEMTHSVPQNQLNLTYRILDMIFFNKYEK